MSIFVPNAVRRRRAPRGRSPSRTCRGGPRRGIDRPGAARRVLQQENLAGLSSRVLEVALVRMPITALYPKVVMEIVAIESQSR